jgi:hypothetical protein
VWRTHTPPPSPPPLTFLDRRNRMVSIKECIDRLEYCDNDELETLQKELEGIERVLNAAAGRKTRSPVHRVRRASTPPSFPSIREHVHEAFVRAPFDGVLTPACNSHQGLAPGRADWIRAFFHPT